MNIHEYQAKELLAKFGVPVPAGHAAMTVDEAVEAAKKLSGPLWVVKAQIHAGGRGKGKFKELAADAKGGVRLSKTIDDVRANATDMLGNTLVNSTSRCSSTAKPAGSPSSPRPKAAWTSRRWLTTRRRRFRR